MLKKLLKHELRATGRIMLPMFAVVLLSSVLANLSSRVLLMSDNDFLGFLGVMLMSVFVLAILAMCIMAFVLMIQRFYKSLLQDEGYVMLTLPVSVHQHVWSKLLCSLLWYVGAAAVAVLAIIIVSFDIEFAKQAARFFRDLVEMLPKLDMSALNIVLFAIEMLLFMLVGAAASCLEFYAALSAGHSFSGNKILLSVAFYFGAQFALQLIFGGITLALSFSGLSYSYSSFTDAAASIHALMLTMILCVALVGAVFYLISTYFLKKRINLE